MKPSPVQLSMFDASPVGKPAKPRRRKRSLEKRYRDWLADHDRTFELFKAFAGQLRQAGHPRIGGKAIAERIRWEGMTTGTGEGDDAYKVPNQYVSRMVRDLIASDATWATYFETRVLKS